MPNPVCIIQARMTSVRYPGKVMEKFPDGSTVIGRVVDRVRDAGLMPLVAMPNDHRQTELWQWCQNNRINWIAPECREDDVLARYFLAATYFKADPIIRVTGDCPALNPNLVKSLVEAYRLKNGEHYFGLDVPGTVPDGMDAEIFSHKMLRRAFEEAQNSYDREHVTPYMKRHEVYVRVATGFNFSGFKLSLDQPDEMSRIWEWIRTF